MNLEKKLPNMFTQWEVALNLPKQHNEPPVKSFNNRLKSSNDV